MLPRQFTVKWTNCPLPASVSCMQMPVASDVSFTATLYLLKLWTFGSTFCCSLPELLEDFEHYPRGIGASFGPNLRINWTYSVCSPISRVQFKQWYRNAIKASEIIDNWLHSVISALEATLRDVWLLTQKHNHKSSSRWQSAPQSVSSGVTPVPWWRQVKLMTLQRTSD